MAGPLQTIASACEAAGETIKGARFVARAVPLDMHRAAAEAAEAIALARSDHDDAVHHGWAYRVGPEHADFRWSDDGEPIGCAGQSILRRIDALGLLNVLVVGSRWGGSQRLSTGDLAKDERLRLELTGCVWHHAAFALGPARIDLHCLMTPR